MKMSNFKILYKVLACFSLFGAVVAGAIWFATAQMAAIDAIYSKIIADDAAGAIDAARASKDLMAFRSSIWKVIAESENAAMQKAVTERTEAQQKFFARMDNAKQHAPRFAGELDEVRSKFQALLPEYGEVEELGLAHQNSQASAVADKITARMDDIIQQLTTIVESMYKSMNSRSDETSETVVHTIHLTYLSVATASAIVFALAFFLVQAGISRPIGKLVTELRKLAEGDFNVMIPGVGRKDEVGMIAAAAEAVVERVGTTIGNIKTAASEVTNASAEISTSTTDLSQRTEEQAASLEETSASMEEIGETVKRNAENARQAKDYAMETSAVAERGGAVVGNAVNAMARIEEFSRKISDIIGVIDEIARQTNLLALNAAVEAARAGDAGRGFAVVASEVRSLAQRSSQAAKDIKDLITNSNSQVKDGVELVNKAGGSLNEIVASIKKVASIVAEIANASIEQSTGIEQVNKALSQMDEVTQQNSALVEENAATAKTLEQQAKSMDQRVAAFRLRTDATRDSVSESAAIDDAKDQARAAPDMRRSDVGAHPPMAPKTKPPRQAVMPKRAVGGGPVGRMQTALATAINADADWKEF